MDGTIKVTDPVADCPPAGMVMVVVPGSVKGTTLVPPEPAKLTETCVARA